MPLDAQLPRSANNGGELKFDMSPLALMKAQRDRLASQFHDLHIEHMILQASLKDVSEQLAAAQQRIVELSTSPAQEPSSKPEPEHGGAA